MLSLRHTLPQVARPTPRCIRLATTVRTGGVEDPFTYCRSLVQKHDYESYLCSHLFPRSLQPGFYALKAFFLELAMVQETVSKPTLGQMRFQFWRDAIRDIFEDRPPRHPIALALYEVSNSTKLQRYHFKRIVDAREQELNNPSHKTMESLVAHAESTYSTLMYLLLALPDLPDTSGELAHAASHIGVAQCIAVLLRALPFHVSRGHLVIPAEIAAKHRVRHEEVFRSAREGIVHPKGLQDAVYDVAVVANDHLVTARRMFESRGGKIPGPVMPIFLAGVPVSSYLTRLEKANFDAFHPSLKVRDWKLPWQMWRGYNNCAF